MSGPQTPLLLEALEEGERSTVWLDDAGVFHTVALPDPTFLMSVKFKRSLDQLMEQAGHAVISAVEAEELNFYKQPHPEFRAADEVPFERVMPPHNLFDRHVETVDELLSLVRSIHLRWRLDAISALDDYCSRA